MFQSTYIIDNNRGLDGVIFVYQNSEQLCSIENYVMKEDIKWVSVFGAVLIACKTFDVDVRFGIVYVHPLTSSGHILNSIKQPGLGCANSSLFVNFKYSEQRIFITFKICGVGNTFSKKLLRSVNFAFGCHTKQCTLGPSLICHLQPLYSRAYMLQLRK